MRHTTGPVVLSTLLWCATALAQPLPAEPDATGSARTEPTDAAPPAPPVEAAPAPEFEAPAPATPEPAAAVALPPTPSPPTEPRSHGPTLEVHGYLQVHYRGHLETNGDGTTTPDDFRVQRVRLGVEGMLFPWLGYDVEFDPRSPDITGILRDAYLSLHVLPHHEIRLGQQKTQFGYENTVSSTRLFVVNRSEVSDNLSRGATLRDLGIGIIGGWPLGGGFKIEDAITLVNGEGMNVQADLTHRKNLWGRLGLRWKRPSMDLRIRLGVSGAIGDQREPFDPGPPPEEEFLFRFRRFGADLEVQQRYFSLAGEIVTSRDELPDETTNSLGYTVTLAGITPWKFGPLVRYDEFEDYTRWTFGAFYGKPKARFRALINYELRTEEDIEADHRFYVWAQGKF